MTPDGEWIVYSSSNPSGRGIWKVRPDGSDATHLLEGSVVLPETSPDGRYALYVSVSGSGLSSRIRVTTIESGESVPFEINIESLIPVNNLGRARWMPDGRGIAYLGTDDRSNLGIFLQDFLPGSDTSASRRQLAGFDPDYPTESFGITRDGSEIVLSNLSSQSALVLAEEIDGIDDDSR